MRALVPFAELAADHALADAGVRVGVYCGEEGGPPPFEGVEFFVLPSRGLADTLPVLRGMLDLKAVQLLSSGGDHVLPYIPAGVQVCNAPSLHSLPTAEVGMSLILAALNQVPAWVDAQRQGCWQTPGPRLRLAGKTVLLLGCGAVGEALAEMLEGFGVRLLRVARRARPGVTPVARMKELLPSADVVVVAVPLTRETRGLVGDNMLALLRDGALLVNIARGPVVDTDSLLSHVSTGRIMAALDVTDPEPLPDGHPLWSCPGVLISPHVGGKAADFRERAIAFVQQQLGRFAAGQPLRHVIQGPRWS